MNIKNMIKHALDRSSEKLLKEDKLELASETFVEFLAFDINEEFKQKNYLTLARAIDNSKVFNTRGNFYDIEVCLTSKIEYKFAPDGVNFVTKSIWQIDCDLDSKFGKATPNLGMNFYKMATGNSENKMLVISETEDMGVLLELIKKVSITWKGNIYLATVTNPSNWGNQKNSVDLRVLKSSGWEVTEI